MYFILWIGRKQQLTFVKFGLCMNVKLLMKFKNQMNCLNLKITFRIRRSKINLLSTFIVLQSNSLTAMKKLTKYFTLQYNCRKKSL